METALILNKLKELEQKYLTDAPTNPLHLLAYDMVQAIKRKTKNYEDPSGLENIQRDIRPILEREGLELDEWIKHKKSDKRSEVESAAWLVSFIEREYEKQPANDEKAQRIRRMKLKARALKLKLKLELNQ